MKATSPTGYTRLESAVMAAMAHDLRGTVPDLAGQFEDSRPGRRWNTGIGGFTEMIVSRDRPKPTIGPASGPDGEFGSVHVMVADLPDPVAFRARFRNGVLLGLAADSYGQPTRGIDFATAPFDCVFTVDTEGRSVEFQPADTAPMVPAWTRHMVSDEPSDTPPLAPPPPPPLINVGALQRVQAPDPLQSLLGEPGGTAPAPMDDGTFQVLLYVVIGTLAVVIVILFEGAFVFVPIAAILAVRAIRNRPMRDRLRHAFNAWQAANRRT